MSRLFFDHLVVLTKVDLHIKHSAENEEERTELWKIVDEIVQREVLDSILGILDKEHHEDFVAKFLERPHDRQLIEYLNAKTNGEAIKVIKKRVKDLGSEILEIIKNG